MSAQVICVPLRYLDHWLHSELNTCNAPRQCVPEQCSVPCGVVWCGVVWCVEGAGTKRKWRGCLAHGKMQNRWALILYHKSDYMPCLLGALPCRPMRAPATRRQLSSGAVSQIHWGRGGECLAVVRPMCRTGCSAPPVWSRVVC